MLIYNCIIAFKGVYFGRGLVDQSEKRGKETHCKLHTKHHIHTQGCIYSTVSRTKSDLMNRKTNNCIERHLLKCPPQCVTTA